MDDSFYKNLPETSGVYLMKNAAGEIIYVGKAGNLRRRVASYFTRPHDSRIEQLVKNIKKIDVRQTDSALEALILESKLIKKHQPPYNVREKDDKSFLYVEIAKENFPRVRLVRGKDAPQGERFGPFTSPGSLREAMKILRRIFPWNTHAHGEIGKLKRECLERQIGLCPGTCVGETDRWAYRKSIKHLKLFFRGEKKKILSALLRDMQSASRRLEFEEAERIRRQIFSLRHIQDVAFLGRDDLEPNVAPFGPVPSRGSERGIRIEGYDISNIGGSSAVGSMVVFSSGGGSALGGENFYPNKAEYRKFRIRGKNSPDDVGMIKEILVRRFKNRWPLPQCILVDGGAGHVNAAKAIIKKAGLSIPVIGIAKGPTRKKTDFVGFPPKGVERSTLVRVRDEAHRFAIGYHKKLRSRNFLA